MLSDERRCFVSNTSYFYSLTIKRKRMNRIFQLLLLFVLPFALYAQDKGVNFEHELSWSEVQAKAKEENKYIFMDCFTTWCGPCKYMTANVFPQAEVGEFFNKNFINVKVQMDKTGGDNESVKKWYDDAKAIADKYRIAAYPTFLYFSPEGKLVHRVVGGGEAKDFIAKSSDALNPSKQYYTLLENFNSKLKKEPADIRNMALASQSIYDQVSAAKYAVDYLATQKNLMTKDNIEFMSQFTNSSKDKGFDTFLKQGDKIDKIMGKGAAAKKVKQIILEEEIYPNLKSDVAPDWQALHTLVAKKYPTYSDEIISGIKVQHYQSKEDWPNFQTEVISYMKKYGGTASPEELNALAWNVFEYCADPKCVEQALEWSKRSFKETQNPMFMDTYANILYKIGKKDEAIVWEEKAMALSNGEKSYQETLDKMKRGEKTWKN
jgi:thioredoxin-related protein